MDVDAEPEKEEPRELEFLLHHMAERTTMDGSALLPALAADPAEARERKESGKMAFLGDSFASLLVSNKQGLGAVMGVFVPCVLSIIGVVLFMRLGWAIGEAGSACCR